MVYAAVACIGVGVVVVAVTAVRLGDEAGGQQRRAAVTVAAPSGTIIFQGGRTRLGVPELLTVSARGGTPAPLRGKRFHGIEPAFSTDGRYLGYGEWVTQDDDRGGRHGNNVVVSLSDGSHPRVVIPQGWAESAHHNWPTWSHDGQLLRVTSSDPARPDSTTHVVAARGGPPRRIAPVELERWAPPRAGRALVVRRGNRWGIAWYEADADTATTFLKGGGQPMWSPTWPEFAFTVGGVTLVFDTTVRKSRVVARTRCGYAGRPAWSPNGDWLAYFTCDPDGAALHVVRRDGKRSRAVTDPGVGGYAPSWRR